MKRYEVWTPRGSAGSWADKALADKAFRRQEAPALLTLGVTVLAAREGTTPRQREAIEALVKAAHPEGEKIVVPTPDPAREQTHRTRPVTAAATAARRRPIDEDDEDKDESDDEGEEDERIDDEGEDDEDDLPTTDAPRSHDGTTDPAPTAQEVPMASKENCAVKGCDESALPVTSKTPKGVEGCCGTHRKAGAWAISCGRATPQNVVQYLSEGPHPKGKTAIAKTRRASAKTRSSSTLSSARKVVPAAAGLGGTITVTVALPDDVARAHHCALAVGIQALEALAELRSDSPITEISAAVALLPARGAR